MSDSKLVSIVMPTYNLSSVVDDTILSVLNQSYSDWELIIVDDCSSDDTPQRVASFAEKDQRIKPLLLDKNVGAGHARNAGIAKANGDYVAFLDGDDIWLPQKLESQISFFKKNPQAEFMYSWYITIDEFGKKVNQFVTPLKISFNLLKYNNYILTSSVICSKSIIEGIKFPEMRKRQDWAFFLDILRRVNFAYALPEVTVLYRKMPNTLSANRWKLIKPNFDFFRSCLFNGNSIAAFFHFILFLPFYFHNKTFNKKKLK